MTESPETYAVRQPSMSDAIVPLIALAVLIVTCVGSFGTWNLSGTIPILVYYGIQVLSPGYFYVATAVICGVVAMSIGSSRTTVGTTGVGLDAIASGFRIVKTAPAEKIGEEL